MVINISVVSLAIFHQSHKYSNDLQLLRFVQVTLFKNFTNFPSLFGGTDELEVAWKNVAVVPPNLLYIKGVILFLPSPHSPFPLPTQISVGTQVGRMVWIHAGQLPELQLK